MVKLSLPWLNVTNVSGWNVHEEQLINPHMRVVIYEWGVKGIVLDTSSSAGDSACFNQGLCRSIPFPDVVDTFLRQVYCKLSLEILTDLSPFILVTCLSLLLLSIHSLGWIPQDSLICWLLILPIFVLPTIFLILRSSHLFPTFICFYMHLSCF